VPALEVNRCLRRRWEPNDSPAQPGDLGYCRRVWRKANHALAQGRHVPGRARQSADFTFIADGGDKMGARLPHYPIRLPGKPLVTAAWSLGRRQQHLLLDRFPSAASAGPLIMMQVICRFADAKALAVYDTFERRGLYQLVECGAGRRMSKQWLGPRRGRRSNSATSKLEANPPGVACGSISAEARR